MLHRELINLGLSDKEAKVYVASLELGPSPVQVVAQKANVNRATTYTNIDALIDMGLMSSYKEGKKFLFYAEAPEKIVYLLVKKQERDLKEKEESLAEMVPQLKALQASGHGNVPVVRYFEGREGVKDLVREALKESSNSKVRMIFPYNRMVKFFSEEELAGLVDLRQRQNLDVLMLVSANDSDMDLDNDVCHTFRQKDFDINCDIAIHDGLVRIISLEEPLAGIIIKDRHIANSMKKMFDLIWSDLKGK